MQRTVLGLAAALFGIGPGSARRPAEIGRVRGGEDATLAASAPGSVVHAGPDRALRRLDLPTLVDARIESDLGRGSVVTHVSGPDAGGRALRVVETAGGRALESFRLDLPGARRTILGGDAPWEGRLGSALAASSARERVAFVAPSEGVRFDDFYAREGRLEIREADRAARLDACLRALDADLSWTADGERLCYVRRVSSDALPASAFASSEDGFGRRLLGSDVGVPAVCLFDVETRRSRVVSVGLSALVTPDGATVLAGDGEGRWRLVDLRSGDATPAPLPGVVRPLAFVSPSLLLYAGLPTAGAPVGVTASYSPLVGPRELPALKLARVDTGAFQTVLPSVDLRAPLSFGRWRPEAHG